jgi:hypothetical protein
MLASAARRFSSCLPGLCSAGSCLNGPVAGCRVGGAPKAGAITQSVRRGVLIVVRRRRPWRTGELEAPAVQGAIEGAHQALHHRVGVLP